MVFSVQPQSATVLALAGELSFATATRARELLQQLGADTQVLDGRAITRADSAGLAVLVECLARAQSVGRTLRCQNLPAQIMALAGLSELSELLLQGLPPQVR